MTGIFTGSSQFTADFQQSISRAVQFASLPVQQMQNELAALQSQSSELNALNTKFSTLQAAVTNLQSALGLGSYTSSTSSSSVATVSLSGAPLAGSYTVQVDSIGTYASAMSIDGLTTIADPSASGLSDATRYTLTVGADSYSVQTTDTTLAGLVNAINGSGAGVQATLVNVGTQGASDYRLSIQDSKMEPVTIQLGSVDGSSPNPALLSMQTTGAGTTYRVNGKPAAGLDPLSTSEASITLSTGVSVRLIGTGTTTITVGRSTDAIGAALGNFASAYNAAQTEINTNRGQGGGALQGDSILSTLSGVLQQLTGYNSGGGVSSLASVGLSFDQNGALIYDGTAFNDAVAGGLGQLTDFFGTTTGEGFLRTAYDALSGLTDSTDGIFSSALKTVQSSIAKENVSIGEEEDRITDLQLRLNQQMAAADAAIAALEQQYGYFAAMFEQMRVNSQNA